MQCSLIEQECKWQEYIGSVWEKHIRSESGADFPLPRQLRAPSAWKLKSDGWGISHLWPRGWWFASACLGRKSDWLLHSPSSAGTNHMPLSRPPSLLCSLTMTTSFMEVVVLAVVTECSLSTLNQILLARMWPVEHHCRVHSSLYCFITENAGRLNDTYVQAVTHFYRHPLRHFPPFIFILWKTMATQFASPSQILSSPTVLIIGAPAVSF